MEFVIDINSTINGKITITDQSNLYDQYLKENSDETEHLEFFKYSETATLNVLTKISTADIKLKEVLLDDHSEVLDSSTFKVDDDGYYLIDHIVLPNIKWLNTASQKNIDYFDVIYLTDGEKMYKLVDGMLEECALLEILEINSKGTTLNKTKIDLIYTGNLQQCYISKCQDLFNEQLDKCNNINSDLIFERDFLWMTINIIDYLVCNKQFEEAQRILENFNKCNSFCKQSTNKINSHHCGCS